MKKSPGSPNATIRAASDGQNDAGHFIVSGALGFDTVPDLMNQALRLLLPHDSIVVDLSGVTSCNSAGLAVVLEIAREMRRRNKSVCFKSLPAQILTFAKAYSIEKELSSSGILC